MTDDVATFAVLTAQSDHDASARKLQNPHYAARNLT